MAFTLPPGFETYFKEWEERIGSFIEYDFEKLTSPSVSCPVQTSPLGGLPFAVKDNIAVEGFSLSCGSKLLEDVKAPYTAAAVGKLLSSGCVPMGKTNLDEFGMGSSTDNSGIKKTNNPWDPERVAGGSSGGSAAAVAAGLVPFALGSDTGGSVRQPAAFCGVVGLKPTYGAVSRFGLVAYASSLEVIGVLSDSISRCRQVFSVIRGRDPMDQTNRDAPASAPALFDAEKAEKNEIRRRVIGVLSPEAVAKAVASSAFGNSGENEENEEKSLKIAAQAAELESEVRRGFEKAKEGLAALGFVLKDVDIPSLKYGVPAYYTIAAAEASANLARFDSIRYGKRPAWAEDPDSLIDKAREAGFGAEVKLRILLGTFVLRSGFQDRYYLRAQRIRATIRRDFEALLGDSEYRSPVSAEPSCDAILLPVFPTRAFGRGETSLSPFAQKAADLYTCCANLAGLPAVSFPASVEGGLPVGVQLIGRAFAEGTILDIAEAWEKAHPFPHPPLYKNFWK